MNNKPSKNANSSEKVENEVKFDGHRTNVGISETDNEFHSDDIAKQEGSSEESSTKTLNKSAKLIRRSPHKYCREFSVGSSGTKSTNIKSKGQAFCDWFIALLSRIFSFPYFEGERICFHRDDLEPADPRIMREAWKVRKEVEDMVNFGSLGIKNMYANILKQRKQVSQSRDKYHFADVDMKSFPRWDTNIINRQRAIFQVFDANCDGAVDYEEFNTVLSEFGDKTPPEIRLKYFCRAKTDEFGALDFDDFLNICYELTGNEIECPSDRSLADTFKKINSNMAIRCKLDVLGQLQGGLL
ncbi:unnamed protein product [Allacma fusca]|uniref:EF-hand domain-containing protein n=1 Tax=Allacma fusca TaxID=39272 RepID=A0A8J2PKX2_9HEXA|nr:unnamed protein product [Allacma fusca]